MRGTYTNAPLTEAICELRFAAGAPWNQTKPGLLFSKLSDDYPFVEERPNLHLGIASGAPSFGATTVGATEGRPRVQFFSADRKDVVQVEQDALIVNRVRPYPGWDVFKSRIERALDLYWGVAEPSAIARAELRYINQFPVSSAVDLERHFNLYPHVPGGKDSELRSMLMVVEVSPKQPAGLFRITFARARLQSLSDALIMDLQMVSDDREPISRDGVFRWLEEAHATIEELFEQSITDETRREFGGVIDASRV